MLRHTFYLLRKLLVMAVAQFGAELVAAPPSRAGALGERERGRERGTLGNRSVQSHKHN